MKTNFFRESVAFLAGIMLLANVFLPGMVVFAEEVVETAPAPVVESTSAPTEEAASVPTEETASAPTEEAASVPTEETASVPTEETASVPTEETASAPVVETASAPTEETASAPTEESPLTEEKSEPLSTQSESAPSESEALRSMPVTMSVQEVNLEMFFSSYNELQVGGLLTEDKKHLDVDATLLAIESTPALVEKLKSEHPKGGRISLEDAKEFIKIGLEKYNPSNHEIFEIDGKLVLFLAEKKDNKSAQVFVNQKDSNLKDVFRRGENDRTQVLWQIDLSKKIAPYGNSSTFRTSSDVGYKGSMDKYNRVISDGKLIGYTIKTDDHYWFYAPVYPTKTFYTSKGIAFELVVDEDGKVAIEKNKELVEKKYAGKQTLIDTVKAIRAAEIHSINGVEVLFAHMADGQTKAFWAENGVNKLAFNNRDDNQPDNSQVSKPIL